MTKRAGVKFRASCGRLRRFAICILLLAIGALVLQVPVHASPTGHANQSAGCVNTDSSPNLADCCQTCLTAAVPVAPPEFGPPTSGEAFTVVRPDPHDRFPEGILRPPRPIAA